MEGPKDLDSQIELYIILNYPLDKELLFYYTFTRTLVLVLAPVERP